MLSMLRNALNLIAVIALLMYAEVTVTAAEKDKKILLVGDGSGITGSGGGMQFSATTGGWGPKWSYMNFKGQVKNESGVSIATRTANVKGSKAKLSFNSRIKVASPKKLHATYTVHSSADTTLTMATIFINPGKKWQGHIEATLADGSTVNKKWPIGKDGIGSAVKSVRMIGADGLQTQLTLTPAVDIVSDGVLRIVVAKKLQKDQSVPLEIEMEFPQEVAFYPTVADAPDEYGKDQWFVWHAQNDYTENNAIVMGDWATEPAGTQGRVQRKGDTLFYADKPIKFWGINLCYRSCAPDKELADKRAEWYAQNGINAVRLHKYADGTGWAGILKKETMCEFDPKGLDRMDYFIAALIKKGIFVKLSASFGSPQIRSADWDAIPYAKEWGKKPKGNKGLKTGFGAIYVSKELQDLQIKQMQNLLKHTNPYLGKTYAEEQGIMLIELVNEESALFYGTIEQLKKIPSVRKQVAEQFTAWLLQRYGSEAAVIERWGVGGLGHLKAEGFSDESFADKSLTPAGNPWFWNLEQMNGSQKPRAPRLSDAALFLKELQDAYYDRFTQSLRDAGYNGEIMASNWQAGSGMSHYYNLHSDQRIGLVDRHNYFGGNTSMLTVAGGGMLSSGVQQVAGRPFSLSEWIHVFPNQWGVEGPAIIGAYGLGLQDWDVSFMFQNRDAGTYAEIVGKDYWNVSTPHNFAVFPAIARQVRRHDIKTSDKHIPLNVHLDSLHTGKVGFTDTTEQAYDIKSFTTDKVSSRALAVSRVAVTYNDEYTETEAFDLQAHIKNGALHSLTGELAWYEGTETNSGYFTINSPATKAVVGFAQNTEHVLGDVTIKSHSKYGALYVTAQSKEGTIATDKRLVIIAIARSQNTDMKYINGKLMAKGKAPILMEPMKATISLKRAGTPTIYICDHDGNRTDQKISVTDGSFTIDGSSSKAVYYEIVYP